MTYATYAPAPVQTVPMQAQAYAPAPVATVPIQAQVKQPKPLTPAQIVFTIVNSELAKFRRAGQTVDAKATRQAYQQHYTGWTSEQLMQAAFNLVQVYDQTTKQWRLVQNEQELKAKQIQFSKRFHYWKNRTAV